MKILNKTKILFVLLILILNLGSTPVSADAIFNLMGLVRYSNGSSVLDGNGSSPNSFARARAYRSNVDSNFAISNKPASNRIYPAGYSSESDPAYFLFDVGSSAWNPPPQSGDSPIVVLETLNGVNGWSGDSYVAGIKTEINQTYLKANGVDYTDSVVVMEKIPTPVLLDNTYPTIQIGWTGLSDNNGAGASNNSIIGYSVYRNDNGGEYELIASVNQDAGQPLGYTDTAVSLGHIYKYKLKVRFEWNAHTPAYYESEAESAASANIELGLPNPDRIVFISSEQTITAGTTSAVITLQTRDEGGNDIPVTSDTTISLSSNSINANKKFVAAASGVCTSSIITSIFLATGSSTAQFCYYDETINADGWTITAAKSSPSQPEWVSGTQKIKITPAALGNFQFNLYTPQGNNTAFTGTNTLTAYDIFGNVKIDFDASSDFVTISASPADGIVSGLDGDLSNQLLSETDFEGGVANLAGKLKFAGISDWHTFIASSASGKIGTSSEVFIRPAAATHLGINMPLEITAGIQFDITSITALDDYGNVDTNFNGTKLVEYSGPASTSLGIHPVYTTGVSFENGISTTPLSTILVKAETTTLTASIGSLAGESNEFTVSSAPAENFSVSAPAAVTAGASFNLNPITAYDEFGNVAADYNGTKTLIYSGPENGPVSGLPSYTTTVVFENGVSVTQLATTLVKAEDTAITVAEGELLGTTANISVSAGEVGNISYVSGNNQTARINTFLPEPLVVEVTDSFGNPIKNYPVTFAVTKGNGFLSSDTPTTGNDGRASTTFSLGSVAASNSDQAQAQIIGVAGSPIIFDATARPNDPSNLIVTASGNVTAGISFGLNLTVVDEESNIIDDYSGIKEIQYSGASNSPNNTAPIYTTSVEFINGVAENIATTLVKVETITITAEITLDDISGTSNTISVSAAETKNFTVVAPATVQSGVSFNLISIQTVDQFGNETSDYSGTKTLEYTGPGIDPVSGNEPEYTTEVEFVNGSAVTILSTKLYKAETTNIIVKEREIEGTSNSISVIYNEDYILYYVAGNNQTGVAGQPLENPLRVLLLDKNGNPVTDKNVVFTPSDGGSVLEENLIDADTGEISTIWTLGTTVGLQTITVSADEVATTVTFSATAVGDEASIINITPPTISAYATYATDAISICLQDQYGNQAVSNLVRTINLQSNSTTGKFAASVNGPWNMQSANIPIGQSCMAVRYKDSSAGNFTFTASGNALTSGTMAINIVALTPTAITVSPTSFTINENSTQQMTAIVYDQFDQSITDAAVIWSINNPEAGTISSNGLFTPSNRAGVFNNAIKASYGGLDAFSTPTITVDPQQPSEPEAETPAPPTQPEITPVTPSVEPEIPTAPIVIEVGQDYFSDEEGTTEVTVEVPVVSVLSPKQGSLILSGGNVSISGTSIPNQLIVVKDEQNNTLGSVISDKYGYWKVFVGRNKFASDQGTITASVFNSNAVTAPLTFDFAPRSILEYIYDLIFSN